MSVSKADLERFLAGHRKASEIMRHERMKRLAHLTEEQARQEYDALCAVWESNPMRASSRALEAKRLAFLLARRRRLDRIAKKGTTQ